jgi:hypothetical protein
LVSAAAGSGALAGTGAGFVDAISAGALAVVTLCEGWLLDSTELLNEDVLS